MLNRQEQPFSVLSGDTSLEKRLGDVLGVGSGSEFVRNSDTIENALNRALAPSQVEQFAASQAKKPASQKVEIKVVDHDGQCSLSFLVGGTLRCTCTAAPEARSEVNSVITLLRRELSSPVPVISEVSTLLARLLSSPGVTPDFPSRQPPTELLLSFIGWFPTAAVQGQLNAGIVHGHPGLAKVAVPLSDVLAAQLTQGEAVYFIVQGRASNDIVAVQIVQLPGTGVSVYACDGLLNAWQWDPLPVGNETSQRIANFLLALGKPETSHPDILSDLGTPNCIQHSVWQISPDHEAAAHHIGRFAAKLTACVNESTVALLDSPVVMSPDSLNSLPRDRRIVARFSFGKHTVAGVFGAKGVEEVFVSTGAKDWFGRDRWVQLFNGTKCRELGMSQIVRSVGETVRSPDRIRSSRAERNVDLDGFGNTLTERSVELLQSLRYWIAARVSGLYGKMYRSTLPSEGNDNPTPRVS